MLESLLTQKVKDRITSIKIKDYEEVFDFFTDRFKDLTKEISSMDSSVVRIIRLDKEKTRFFELFEYKLELQVEEDFITVLKGEADKREVIGEVVFQNHYAIAKFRGDTEDYLLTYNTVDQFFSITFEPLFD